jgi:bacterioferritin (cytochrome b1)
VFLPGRPGNITRRNEARRGVDRTHPVSRWNVTELLQLNVGANVKLQIENDFKLELNAVGMFKAYVKLARDEGDNASREQFEKLLKDGEAHVDWLEAQVHQMKELVTNAI